MRNAGFTLIELVVVMSLISLLLVFTLPRFQSAVITGPTTAASQWIVGNVQSLKASAYRDRKQYALNIAIGEGRMWITDAAMTEEALELAAQGAYVVPDAVRILDVEYPDRGSVSVGNAAIYFTDRGYSDKVMIHLENDSHDQLTLHIEPFLSQVRVYDEYRSFRD